MNESDLILKCMLDMDWKAIHKIFVDNNFAYSDGEIPDISNIQDTAKELLQYVIYKYEVFENKKEFDYMVSTGRFTAYGYTDSDGYLVMELEFVPFSSVAVLEE